MKLGLARGKWMLKRSRFMKRSSTPMTVRVGRREFVKLNVTKYDWRDIYNFILTLSWPQFAGLLLGIYVLFNLCFATLYLLGGRCIAGLVPGSFSDAFFFSVVRHVIDETSPLFGLDPQALKLADSRMLASVVCVDPVMQA